MYRYGTSLGVLSQGTYTFNATKSAGAQSIYLTAKLNDVYAQTTISSVPFSFTADGDSEYIIRTANNTGTTWEAEKYSNMMLNLGSEALPYSPYNRTTTPIYLGEVQTTRRVKKLVFDGTENWNKYAQDSSRWLYYLSITKASVKNAICTHCQYSSSIPNYSTVGVQVSNSLVSLLLNLGEIIGDNTLESFKSYLAAQYANGTPVTVWYVLAEPETAVVNEPLRKIGDYADTVSYEQAGVQIPTVKGNTVIDVETELKPSQMYIKYK